MADVKFVIQTEISKVTVLETGAPGPRGSSAYEIAIKDGYTGNEVEWLASLEGKDGATGSAGTNGENGKSAYQVAQDNGFIGTVQEWLISLVGSDGVAGKSAYELACDNGYIGTLSQWIASLKGADGQAGSNGANGSDGKSAYQVALDGGFVGTVSEWLLSLKGTDGQPGTNGVNGSNGSDGASAYTLAVLHGYPGTLTEWLESLVGSTGSAGSNGTNGTDGATWYNGGSDPISGGVNGDFYLQTATYEIWKKISGTWTDTGVNIKGDTGSQGIQGAAGATGPGVPTGGATGQILAKNSTEDYDAKWIDAPSGGASSFSALSDFSIDRLTDGDSPQYDAARGLWVNKPADGSEGVATPHKSWRILGVTGGGLWFRVQELQFRSSAGSAENPTGGTAIASSEYPGQGAGNAFDGDTGTQWACAAYGTAGQWIGYTFAEAKVVEEVAICQSTGLTAFTLQYADNDGIWHDYTNYTGLGSWEGTLTSFYTSDPAPRPKYVKMLITNPTDKQKIEYDAASGLFKNAGGAGDGYLYVPATGSNNTGKVLTAGATPGSAAWQEAGSDGGSVVLFKDRIYVPAGADLGYDDEFDDGNLSSVWSKIDVSGYENTYYEVDGIKGLSVNMPSGAGGMKVRGLVKPFTELTYPFYIETAASMISRGQDFPGFGPIFCDGNVYGSGVQVLTPIMTTNNLHGIQRWTGFNSRTNLNELNLLGNVKAPCVHIRLVWENENAYRALYSIDGIVWIDSTGLQSLTLTPTFFGIFMSTFDNSTYPLALQFLYFRVRSGLSING